MHYFGGLFELCAVAFFIVGWQQIEMAQDQQYFVHAIIYLSRTAYLLHFPPLK
jgi:hypothetical protein